jgi:hypothetical protein
VAYDREAWRASVQNGRIPRDKLEQIDPVQFDPDLGGPALMHPEAAEAMGTLIRQAWEDGATGLLVKYSYRTFAKQQEKWDNYKGPDGRIGTGDDGNLAAQPGTSNHGWAVAVDFTGLGENEINWLRRNSRRFGFVNDVPSEVWHYTYFEHLWNGDDMTEGERDKLEEAFDFTKGARDCDEAIAAGKADPKPGDNRSRAYKDGFLIVERAYKRPKA